MVDAKLHRTKPSIPVTATSEATDVSGAVETEEGHGRKKAVIVKLIPITLVKNDNQ